jgi:tetratricopeptide (TPR) repeat protein
VWVKAVTYLRQAGAKSLERSASREALALFEQALVALERLPESRETIEQAIDIRLDLRRTLVPLAERARILDHMQKAESLAQAIGDQRRLSWVAYGLAHYHYLSHDQEQTVEVGQRALAFGGGVDVAHVVAVNHLLGHSLHMTGDYRQATAALRRNIAVLVGDRARERFGLPIFPTFPGVTSRERMARCLGELGEFPEAIALGEEGLRLAEEIDHPPSLTGACLGLGTLLMRRDDLGRALPILERGLTVGRRGSIYLYVFTVATAVGRAYAMMGRVAEGLALMAETVNEAESKDAALGHGLRLMWLAEGHLAAGEPDRAWDWAQRALEFSRRFKERGQEAWTLHLLGELSGRREALDVEGTEHYFRAAMAIAEPRGMRPALAHCHLGLGELYARAARAAEAADHLRTAAAAFREMDIASLRQRAEKQLGAPPG